MIEARADAELVRSAQRGDRDAFACLFSRHVALARRLTQRLLKPRDGLEDVIQDAALQAWLNLNSLRDASSFGPWLAGISLNIARHAAKRAAGQPLSWDALFGGRRVTDEPLDPSPGPDEASELREFSARIRGAVDELPPGQRQAVLLVYLQGLSYRETALVLGVELGALKTRLHKGRAKLQKRLHDLWKEDIVSTSVEPRMIEMRVADVRRHPAQDDERERSVVLLKEVDGTRQVPFWVGHWEGDSIALLLEKVKAPRPLTHAFTASLLRAGGVKVTQVRIHRLAEETFYAEVVLEGSAGQTSVDARPSDSVALALELDIPIYVAADVVTAVHAGVSEDRPEPPVGAKEIVSGLIENWWPPSHKPTRSD